MVEKALSEMYDLKVFNDDGNYVGDVEEAILTRTKVKSWKVKITPNSCLIGALKDKNGVLIPQQNVRAISDIMIVSNLVVP